MDKKAKKKGGSDVRAASITLYSVLLHAYERCTAREDCEDCEDCACVLIVREYVCICACTGRGRCGIQEEADGGQEGT